MESVIPMSTVIYGNDIGGSGQNYKLAAVLHYSRTNGAVDAGRPNDTEY
jgi:hypothetical protein